MTDFINWEKRDPGYHVVYAIECLINSQYFLYSSYWSFTKKTPNPFNPQKWRRFNLF